MSPLTHLVYIDPGSGSLLFQMLLSGLLTILVFFKRVSVFTRALFSRKGISEIRKHKKP